MFYSEYYANRIAAVEAEIANTARYAAMINSPYEVCRKRAKRAEKRLVRLREQIDALMAAATVEAAMDA